MKIVIDINDKLYDRIKYLEPTADTMLDKLMRSVQNGMPLPEHHGRLIDADKLTESILCKTFGLRSVDIDNAPTIIEADVSDIYVGNI